VLSKLLHHLRWRWRRLSRPLVQASKVREWPAYLIRELSGRRIDAIYTVGCVRFRIRHRTDDTGVFHEIFCDGFYRLPRCARQAIEEDSVSSLVVDLGANIGLYGAWVRRLWPNAKVIAFEPDEESAKTYREFMDLNDLGDRWELIQACAGTRSGTRSFESGKDSESRIVADEAGAASTVTMIDVFPYLKNADVIKMDIEGGEWEIILDPRWSQVGARAVLMEYHPHLCPSDDAKSCAIRALENAGFAVELLFHHPRGHGMVRALKLGARPC
jgi:FkbM family methyltransferase